MTLSSTDMKILEILQDDARVTNQVLAEKINISASPCWRKVRKLEEDKVIQGYRAVLDRKKIGLGVMVFIRVVIDSHSEAEARKFEEEVTALEDVVACYSIGGDADFLLQVVASIWTPMLILQCQWYADCQELKKCRVCLCLKRSNHSLVILLRKSLSSLSLPGCPVTDYQFRIERI